MKAYTALWGKLSVTDANRQWHPLFAHMLDVAAVSKEILNREPASTRELYASDFGIPWNDAEAWLLFFIALHDIGKATPSFQKMCEDKLPELQSSLFEKNLIWDENVEYVHHGQLGQAIFDREIRISVASNCYNLEFISRSVNDHHGFHDETDIMSNLRPCGLKRSQRSWQECRNQLIQDLMELFINTQLKPDYCSFKGQSYVRTAGLTSFADWIGSNENYFPYIGNEDEVSIHEYWSSAIQKAKNALDSIGWMKKTSLYKKPPSFNQIIFDDKKYEPRPLQNIIEKEILTDTTDNGSCLILIEAPTGEGKTEAAFYAHIALQYRNQHRGMYIALPSQATGNAMFLRTLRFLTNIDQSISVDLQLIHGAAILNDEYQKLRISSIYDSEGTESSVLTHDWFTYKKRALLSEYGVGTIDQALLSVLNIKHGFVRLWGLGNRTIVIDEVHAYDVYTSTIIDRLLIWLKALGSSVIIMSATLPQRRRSELLNAWGAMESEDAAYPRLMIVDVDGQVKSCHFPADEKRKRNILIKPAPVEISELETFALNLISDGGCAAIVVNTVQRAQDLYIAIKERNSEIDLFLFHARLTAEERKKKEEMVLSIFGKSENNTKRPTKSILIATQVVEQSLDLDFDVMISDLAPIDLLLQRAGRIHRHERPLIVRYRHLTPILYVCGMGGDELPVLKRPLFWDRVYMPYILYRTWIILGKESIIKLPDSIDEVIENVYGDGPIDEKWANTNEILESREDMQEIIEEDRSVVNCLLGKPVGEEWANPSGLPKIEDDEIKPGTHLSLYAKTRKGDQSITLIILHDINNSLRLDEHDKNAVDLYNPVDIKETKRLLGNSISLSRIDIFTHFIDKPVPNGWKKNPLLRNCRPLILNNHEYNTGKTIVRYTKELGVYYEKAG